MRRIALLALALALPAPPLSADDVLDLVREGLEFSGYDNIQIEAEQQ